MRTSLLIAFQCNREIVKHCILRINDKVNVIDFIGCISVL
jgi:hypothetical protein